MGQYAQKLSYLPSRFGTRKVARKALISHSQANSLGPTPKWSLQVTVSRSRPQRPRAMWLFLRLWVLEFRACGSENFGAVRQASWPIKFVRAKPRCSVTNNAPRGPTSCLFYALWRLDRKRILEKMETYCTDGYERCDFCSSSVKRFYCRVPLSKMESACHVSCPVLIQSLFFKG